MAPTKSGWTKYGTDQIWLDQKWLRPNMGLDQIWVGPNMGPTKYAGPNLVRPKMADQKCLDQIWLDTLGNTLRGKRFFRGMIQNNSTQPT